MRKLICGCARDGSFICDQHKQASDGLALIALSLFGAMVLCWAAILT